MCVTFFNLFSSLKYFSDSPYFLQNTIWLWSGFPNWLKVTFLASLPSSPIINLGLWVASLHVFAASVTCTRNCSLITSALHSCSQFMFPWHFYITSKCRAYINLYCIMAVDVPISSSLVPGSRILKSRDYALVWSGLNFNINCHIST